MILHDWTDERVDKLKRLWLAGLSASQVARRLGGVSRSAVMGKLHRLGLTGEGARRPPKRAPAVGVETPIVWAKPTAAARPCRIEPVACGWVRDLAQLQPHHCRWPLGDPATAGFSFCGRDVASEGPYCATHRALAFAPRPAAAARPLSLIQGRRP